jgi:TPR repeat protein
VLARRTIALLIAALGVIATASWAGEAENTASTDPGRTGELNLLGCLQLLGGAPARARDFFERGATSLPAARFNLGLMLARGEGGDAQPSRARRAIESAWSEAALPEAGAWLLETAMGRQDIRSARAIAARLQSMEHPRGDLAVARLRFAEGRFEQAHDLTQRAARAGEPRAARLLAMLDGQGTGFPRDAMEASSWKLIAEAMLSPGRPTDSVFQAAVKQTLQANDWMPQGAVQPASPFACHPAVARQATPAEREPSAMGAVRPMATGEAVSTDVAGVTAAAGTAAMDSPVGRSAHAVSPDAPPPASTSPALTSPAPTPPDAEEPRVSAITDAVAAGSSAPVTAPSVFELRAGAGVRSAWTAYGETIGIPATWVGADVKASADARVQPRSMESLGLLLVDSARIVGVRLRLQLQTDAEGAVRAARIVRLP